MGSIPGRGAKIPQAAQRSPTKQNKKPQNHSLSLILSIHSFTQHTFIECLLSVQTVDVLMNVTGIFLQWESYRILEKTGNTNVKAWM